MTLHDRMKIRRKSSIIHICQAELTTSKQFPLSLLHSTLNSPHKLVGQSTALPISINNIATLFMMFLIDVTVSVQLAPQLRLTCRYNIASYIFQALFCCCFFATQLLSYQRTTAELNTPASC